MGPRIREDKAGEFGNGWTSDNRGGRDGFRQEYPGGSAGGAVRRATRGVGRSQLGSELGAGARQRCFGPRVAEATAGDGWVVDGNYSKTRDITWPRATTIVWLDYPLPLILWRLGLRILRRAVTRERLWQGNQESLRTHLFTKESLILWALQTYKRRKREYGEAMYRWESEGVQALRFGSPKETERWLRAL